MLKNNIKRKKKIRFLNIKPLFFKIRGLLALCLIILASVATLASGICIASQGPQQGSNNSELICSKPEIFVHKNKLLVKYELNQPAKADFGIRAGASFFHVRGDWSKKGENIISMKLEKSDNISAGTGITVEVYLKKINLKLQSRFGGLGNTDGRFISPKGMSIDFKDNLFLADTGNDRIQKFNKSGVYLDQFGEFSWDDISETSEDTGEILDGSFNEPLDVACGLNSIFVLDSENHRVSRFDRHFVFVCAFGGQGDYDGEFETPSALDIDDVLNIYVLDSENDCIQKFDVDGNFIMRYGRFGWSEGLLNSPEDLCCLQQGLVWVADTGNSRLIKYDEFGNFIKQTGPFYEPFEFDDSSQESLKSKKGTNQKNKKRKNKNRRRKKSSDKGRSDEKRPCFMIEPVSIDNDNQENIYVADADSGRVLAFDNQGRLMGYTGPVLSSNPGKLLVFQGRRDENLLFVSDSDNNRVLVYAIESLEKKEKYNLKIESLTQPK